MISSAFALTLSLSASASFEAGRSVDIVKSGEIEREASITLPPQISSKKTLPLVLLLHGFTGSPGIIEGYSGFARKANSEGFILVSPKGTGKPTGWNCGFINLGSAGVDDLTYLDNLLERMKAKYPVDPKRVFVVGHSNGAMMANAFAAKFASKITGIGCVAGLIGVGRTSTTRKIPDPKAAIDVIHIHGIADSVVGYSRESSAFLVGVSAVDAIKWWATANGIKSEPRKTELSGCEVLTYEGKNHRAQLVSIPDHGHDWAVKPRAPINATDVIWDFFKKSKNR